MTGRLVAAVDLGASSGRVMVGRVAPNELALTEVHRFPNEPVRLPDGLHWDMLRLYGEVIAGLRGAARAADGADGLVSVGVVQARASGLLSGDLETLRALVRGTQDVRRYEPRATMARRGA